MYGHLKRMCGPFALTLLLISGCTITTNIEPVPPGSLSAICIKENTAVWSKEFLPALRQRFEKRGIKTSVYTGELPDGCDNRLEYDANWSWDLAVYLVYADIRVYDGDRIIGRATFDARGGGGRMDKFGTTEGRLDELIDQLLRGFSATVP
jgi:hypothetical protein